MKARTVCLTAMAIALIPAAPGAAQQPAEWQISAEPRVQIGVVEGAPEYQLFDAVSSVRMDDGRIVVLNAGSHELRIYDADGRFVRGVGREGDGPGEFRAPARVYRLGSDSLMVYDHGTVRFSVHSPAGEFVRTEPAMRDRTAFPLDEWLYDRSWIDGPPMGRGRGAVRAVLDALPAPDTAIGYRYVKVSPQGHLWVRQPHSPGAAVPWTVYDLDARPIARVTTPARFDIHEIGPDYVLGTGRDELDVEYIQLFGLSGDGAARARPIPAADAGDAPARRTLPDAALSRAKSAVKHLASRQEIFYASGNFTYATHVEQLEDWEPPEELLVRIVAASRRGWTGLIIDRATGATCGLSFGALPPVGWQSGYVVCE